MSPLRTRRGIDRPRDNRASVAVSLRWSLPMDPLLLGTAGAFGLAAAAGLNTTLPLLIVGLLARFGLLSLASPYDALASDVALGGLAVLALLEILGDKVPGLDSFVQAVQLPLAATAGAILFASQNSVVTSVAPGLSILIGVLTAGSVHAARASIRPAVTALTFGLGNTAVSFVEDACAILLSLLAVLAPLAGLVLVLVLAITLGLTARWAMLRGGRLARRLRASGRAEPAA
jgi:hypothetical protein